MIEYFVNRIVSLVQYSHRMPRRFPRFSDGNVLNGQVLGSSDASPGHKNRLSMQPLSPPLAWNCAHLFLYSVTLHVHICHRFTLKLLVDISHSINSFWFDSFAGHYEHLGHGGVGGIPTDPVSCCFHFLYSKCFRIVSFTFVSRLSCLTLCFCFQRLSKLLLYRFLSNRYVGNLDPSVTEELIVVLFGQIGTVKGCKIIHEVHDPSFIYSCFSMSGSRFRVLSARRARELAESEFRSARQAERCVSARY